MNHRQESLFGEDDIPPPSTLREILAFDPTILGNAQRIGDLATLGYIRPPILDCTWGLGAMWGTHDPLGLLVGSDLDPRKARDVIADVHNLPFPDDTFHTVVFDPPYKTQGGDGTGRASYADRYGHEGSLLHGAAIWTTGLAECFRVSTRYVIVKCQDQVDRSAHICWQTIDVANEARRHGWFVQDMLHLANPSFQPGVVRQRHARRNYSTFVVLRYIKGKP